jgi:hypothetical protein
MSNELTDADILRIAADTGADPRTVRAVADGTEIRGKHKLDRIRRAIEATRGQAGVVRGDVDGAVPTTKREA